MRFKWAGLVGVLILLLGVTAMARRAAASGRDSWTSHGPGPAAVEDAFFAGFESEPAGLSSHFFSLDLESVPFDFIFTAQGDNYGLFGFSHQTTYGLGGGGSIRLQSGTLNYETMERVDIVRNDGQDFILGSLHVNNRGGAPVTVSGLDNGQQVGDGQTVGNGAEVTLDFGGIVVDELRLTSLNFYDTNIDAFQGNTTADKDYGDLPAAYGLTSDGDNGARHLLGPVYLGACVDADADGQPSPMADGDDGDGAGTTHGTCSAAHADEDGVVTGSNWQNGPDGGNLVVTVSGGAGCLSGWIDWAGDGAFSQPGDHILDRAPLAPGQHTVAFDVPDGVFTGGGPQLSFYARLRLIADEGLVGQCADDGVLGSAGPAASGEVEDYLWQFSPTAVSLTDMAIMPPSMPRSWLVALGFALLLGTALHFRRVRAGQ